MAEGQNSTQSDGESWADVPGTEPAVSVSTAGRARINGQPAEPYTTTGGYRYLSVGLAGKRRGVGVHRLVLLAFVGPPPEGHQAAHLDGTRINNALSNLKWCSPKENCSHKKLHGTQICGEQVAHSKLTEKDVMEIRRARSVGVSRQILARQFKVYARDIDSIVMGRRWAHLPLLPVPRQISLSGAKITAATAEVIRSEYAQFRTSYDRLAARYGITKSAIHFVVKGITWRRREFLAPAEKPAPTGDARDGGEK